MKCSSTKHAFCDVLLAFCKINSSRKVIMLGVCNSSLPHYEKCLYITLEWYAYCAKFLNPLSANFTKWLNTLKQFAGNLPANCLSVFGHFVGLAFKGLRNILKSKWPLMVLAQMKHVDMQLEFPDNKLGEIDSLGYGVWSLI